MSHSNLKPQYSFFIIVLILSALLYSASWFNTSTPFTAPTVSKEDAVINIKPAFYQGLSLGFARLLSSTLWISTLLESDIEHYKGDGNSWMYFRFITISKLEPKFYKNYFFGGQYLSIVKDDVYGADTLYSMGLEQYPKDFWLSYHAGFNAAFEIGDTSLALKYYGNIYHSKRVQQQYPTLLSIINKLRLQNGDLSLGQIYDLLLSTWLQTPNGNIKVVIGDYLYAIKAEIDLICLNSIDGTSDNCSKSDFDGEAYILDLNQKWKTAKEWTPFRLKDKKKNPINRGSSNGNKN
tara:strand:- start:28624 stop:29502 length:879 start_codon:yes stop_codon:yes gene_type:complete